MPLRIVIVDDQRIFRAGLCAQFDLDDNYDIEVVGQYSNTEDAIAAVLELRPDITLMDLQLPRANGEKAQYCGASAIRTIKRSWPEATIVVISMHEDAKQAREALSAGVCGYLLKSDETTDYAKVLPQIAGGQCVFDRRIMDLMPALISASTNGRFLFDKLTGKENETVELMADGLSNLAIARRLRVSNKTIANRLPAIYDKLDVTDRYEAIEKVRLAKLEQDADGGRNPGKSG